MRDPASLRQGTKLEKCVDALARLSKPFHIQVMEFLRAKQLAQRSIYHKTKVRVVPLQRQRDGGIRELTLENAQVACRGSAPRCVQQDGTVREEDIGASVQHGRNAFLVALNRHDFGGKL